MSDKDQPGSALVEGLNRWTRRFERGVILVLICIVALLVAISAVELLWNIFEALRTPPTLLMQAGELLNVFGFVLLVLIGLELLETIRAYLRTNVVHVELVLEVALVAVARKAIVFDLEKYGAMTLVGLAALILALAVAFHLERRARRSAPPPTASAVGMSSGPTAHESASGPEPHP